MLGGAQESPRMIDRQYYANFESKAKFNRKEGEFVPMIAYI